MDFLAVTLLCLLCFAGRTSSRALHYCYADNKHPYVYTGTKTAYELVRGRGIGSANVPGCEPVSVWVLARHGTRYPSLDEIIGMHTLGDMRDEIVKNFVERKSDLCKKDIDNLKKWQPDPTVLEKESKNLHPQGTNDLGGVGQRLRQHLPELFKDDPTDLKSKAYKFRSTDVQRTRASMKALQTGIFGYKNVPTEVVPEKEDSLLMPYKNCKAWQREKETPRAKYEVEAFINGTEFKNLIENISKRLGFSENLSLDTILSMYATCRFEKAWKPYELSPWCAVFSMDEMKVLEYEDDLYQYYRVGYGDKFNRAMGCPLAKDLYIHLRELEQENKEEPKGIFYLGHSAGLQLFYTAMGIAEDFIPLTAANFRAHETHREWRTSFTTPFGTNFAAVTYKCKIDDVHSNYKVMLYLAERPLLYKGCDLGLCDSHLLRRKLWPLVTQCNLNFCDDAY